MLDTKEVAEKYNVHPSRISRWRKAGKLKGSYKKISGKYNYDEEKLDICVKENINQAHRETQQKLKNKPPTKKEMVKQVTEAGTGKLTLFQAQTIQAQYKAALLKLEYEEKSGMLIKKEQVDMDFFNCARRTRDAILNVPDRISAELSAMKNQHEINQKIITELNAALEELSREEELI